MEEEGGRIQEAEGAAVITHLCSTTTSPPLAAEVVDRTLETSGEVMLSTKLRCNPIKGCIYRNMILPTLRG